MDKKTKKLIMEMNKAVNKGQVEFELFTAKLWTLPDKTQETFLWTALALQMGHTRFGVPNLKACKKAFPHIENKQDLIDLWCSFETIIKDEFHDKIATKWD